MKKYFIQLIKSPFFYFILFCWIFMLYNNQIEDYNFRRWYPFNERFIELEKEGVLSVSNTYFKPNYIDYTFSEDEIIKIINENPELKEDKIISNLLINHPIDERGFLKEYNIINDLLFYIISIFFLIVLIFGICCFSFFDKKSDFGITMYKTLKVMSILSIIGFILKVKEIMF